jgi:hypothetical protein
MFSKECTEVIVMLLRNANMMVLMQCTSYWFAWESTFCGESRSDAAKTGFATLNSSQLFDKTFLVRALVPSFGSAMFQLTLDEVQALASD